MIQVASQEAQIGKTVQIRRGPAAVTGDAAHKMSLAETLGWEDVGKQMIQEPEDLPELRCLFSSSWIGKPRCVI